VSQLCREDNKILKAASAIGPKKVSSIGAGPQAFLDSLRPDNKGDVPGIDDDDDRHHNHDYLPQYLDEDEVMRRILEESLLTAKQEE